MLHPLSHSSISPTVFRADQTGWTPRSHALRRTGMVRLLALMQTCCHKLTAITKMVIFLYKWCGRVIYISKPKNLKGS